MKNILFFFYLTFQQIHSFKIIIKKIIMNIENLDASKFGFLINQSKTNPNEVNQIKINEIKALQLPRKFEILYSQTKVLIIALINYLKRRQASHFSKVKDVIERETNHTFTQLTLRRCVRILPEGAIILEWHQDMRRNLPNQLTIVFVSAEPIDELFSYSRNYLTDLVKEEHIKFLKQRNLRIPKEFSVWHHEFNLDSVPDVIPVELKSPEIKEQNNIFESLQPIIKKKEKQISEITINEPERIAPKSCQNLSSYFDIVKKVQEKVSLNQALWAIGAHKETEDILKIADIINLSFTSKRKRSLPLNEITSTIKKNKVFNSFEPQKINKLVDNLIMKSDGYFTKLHLSGNDFLKIDDKRSYQTVRGPIYKAVMEIEV